MKDKFKNLYYILRETTKFLLYRRNCYILIEGYPESKNFGDALNIPLTKFLSEKKRVVFSKFVRVCTNRLNAEKSYAVIGSVVQSIRPNVEVWGTGLLRTNVENFPIPNKIHAVRGPVTRDFLINKGIECPSIYGDPALLLPLIYFPIRTKKYKYGVIPHYEDADNEWIKFISKRDDVLIIDLLVGVKYEKVIDELLDCEVIFTSSLHGLIVAYAYGIPVRHIKLSDNLIGGNLKFDDFMKSIGKEVSTPIDVNSTHSLEDLSRFVDKERMNYNVDELVNCCPFITASKKKLLLDADKKLRKDKY